MSFIHSYIDGNYETCMKAHLYIKVGTQVKKVREIGVSYPMSVIKLPRRKLGELQSFVDNNSGYGLTTNGPKEEILYFKLTTTLFTDEAIYVCELN